MNIASRILINLFFPEFLDRLAGLFSIRNVALSPVVEHDANDLPGYTCLGTVLVRKGAIESPIKLFLNSDYQVTKTRIASIIPDTLNISQPLLRFLTKKQFSLQYVDDPVAAMHSSSQHHYRVDIFCSCTNNQDFSISFVFGNLLMQFFSPQHTSELTSLAIENDILRYFSSPFNHFPRLGPLVNALDDSDLQSLLYALLKSGRLTPYQISLMLSFIPGMSLRFKHNLPPRVFLDAVDIKKRMDSRSQVSRRDISAGVYSIEEAIYHILDREINISISRPLLEMKKLISLASSLELFNLREFPAWLELMKSEKLLVKSLAMSGERVLVSALSGNPSSYLKILTGELPVQRIKELFCLSEPLKTSPFDKLHSQHTIINNYRKLKVHHLNKKADSCEYLILSFNNPGDYTRLVFEAGWYTVSTAAKGFKKKVASRLLQDVYAPARFLIEDVLNGTLNPNILHDEMQIHKAQDQCVAVILSLYEGGIIDLSV